MSRRYTAAEAQALLDAARLPDRLRPSGAEDALRDAAPDLVSSLAATEAERDAAVARLTGAREIVSTWRHGEDCPAGAHEECDPDAEDGGGDCLEGDTLDECRAAKAVCECGSAALRALLSGDPPSDARTLGRARATAEKLRADVAFWRRSSEAAHARSVEAARLRGERDEARARAEAAEREVARLRAAVRKHFDADNGFDAEAATTALQALVAEVTP